MAGSHRTPGAPAPTRAQRRVAWCGPLLLLAFTAIWTMDALPGPAQAASAAPRTVQAAAAEQAAAVDRGSSASALPGAPGQAPARPPALLTTAQVLTGTAPSAASSALVQRCRTAVATGEDAARAGGASYRDWAQHVQAQLDLDTGRTTWLGAVETWNATRSAGGGDARAFEQAVRRRAATAGACGTLAAQTTGQVHEAATACQRRAGALDALVAAAGPVTADWARHLDSTRVEAAHAPGGPQALPWLGTARSALPALGRFRQARAALLRAPACRLA